MGDEVTGRELRLALAMRGGVSLAVWIGGAVAELDLARRAMAGAELGPAEAPRGRAYAALLRAAGYDGLRIDVLAGASAGGLNAVVLGYTQSVGGDLDWLADVWREQGDLWGLLHGAWRGREPFRTESLLRGDAVFYRAIRAALQDRPGGEAAVDYLTVDLSATLQEGPPLRSLSSSADLRPPRAHFRFRRTPGRAGGPFNDLPTPTDRDDELVRRLAYAARTTSSFPGAFEPATVVSWVPQEGRRPRPTGDDLPENLAAVFSEAWTDPDAAFAVLDGGVLDNIPIARAFEAIAGTPARGPTERLLLYLDPSPPSPRPAPDRPPAWVARRDGRLVRLMRATLLRSAVAALGYKVDAESATDDLQDLHALRTGTDAVTAARRQFVRGLPATLAVAGPTAGPDDPYRQLRAQLDGDRLVELLTAPGVGFLRSLVRQPAVAFVVDQERAVRLREELLAALRDRSVVVEPAHDATALAATADVLVAWLRLLEETGRLSGARTLVAAVGGPKAALYRVRAAATLAREAAAAAAVASALRPRDDHDPSDPAELERARLDVRRLAALWWPAEPPVPPDPDPYAAPDDTAFWDRLAAFDGRRPGAIAGLVAAGWQALAEIVDGVDTPSGNPLLAHRDGVPMTPADVQVLGRAALLVTGALPATSVPRFDSITGDERPPGPPPPRVAQEGLAQALDRAARSGARPVTDRLVDSGSKLAGAQLVGFAGFLSADWRTHDWQWGRADAGAGLLRILGLQADGTVPAPLATAYADLAREVAALAAPLDRPRPRLSSLPAERRFALVTRLLHGALRALWPLTPQLVRPAREPAARNPVGAAALVLLRPLLVLLPLLTRPVLLAGPAVAVLTADVVAGRGPAGRPAVGTATALALLAVLLGLVRLHRSADRWAAVRATTGSSDDGRLLCDRVLRRVGTLRGLLVLEGLLVVLGAVAALTRPAVATAATAPVLAAVVLGVGAADLVLTRVTATATIADRAPPDRRGQVVGAVAALGALAVAGIAVAGGRSSGLGVLGTAWAVATLTFAVHDHWSGRVWPWVSGLGSGVAAAALLGPGDEVLADLTRRGAHTVWADAVVPAAALLATYAVARFTKQHLVPLTVHGAAWGLTLGLLALVVTAMAGALAVDAVWGWPAVPTGLLLAGAACAATTLVTPYADIADPGRG